MSLDVNAHVTPKYSGMGSALGYPPVILHSTPACLNLRPARRLNPTSHCHRIISDVHSGNKRPWLNMVTF